MSFSAWMMIIFILTILSGFYLQKKKKGKYGNILVVTAFVILIFGDHLPGRIFGGWNSIKQLTGKKISHIILRPSEPRWKVNLTDTIFQITDSNQIAQLIALLKETDMYFPSHPMRIWETGMIIITKGNARLHLTIDQTDDEGTVVHNGRKDFKKDKLGKLLEKITKYTEPQYGQKNDRAIPVIP